MNDIELASYGDDNAISFVGDDLNDVILKLQNSSKTLFKWFNEAKLKLTKINVILLVALA